MVSSFEHPVEGVTSVLSSPLKLSGTPVDVRLPPPLLGQHNDEILAELRADASRTAGVA
jgi:crotonobetainyl-CoA:carnitine CoA-transferase CaiB-like acyl-CoA transferase